jgi:hypothetical protein
MAPGRSVPRCRSAVGTFVAEPTAESPIVVGKRKEVQEFKVSKVSKVSRLKGFQGFRDSQLQRDRHPETLKP